MEEKQYHCEEHNTFHIGECPICKDEKIESEIEQNKFNFLLVFIGFLCIINLILFVLLNI